MSQRESGAERRLHLLVLTAPSEEGLETVGQELTASLEGDADLGEVAKAQYAREALPHRRAVVAHDAADGRAALGDEDRWLTQHADGRGHSVVFMFSGQGAQYPNMGRGVYHSEPAFRRAIDQCCEILEPHLGRDLRDLLLPAEGAEAEAAEALAETRFTQPALFVIEYATAQLWMSWGVEPAAMIGHSVGEYVAACLAGVFPLDAGLALVAERGRLMQGLPPGDMLTVPLSEEDVIPHLTPEVSIAALNAPGRSVVAGPAEAIAALAETLKGQRVRARTLHTSHAFHSPMMEPILEPFVAEVSNIDLQAPRIPYVSNVTGTWITAEEATDPQYYARHIVGTVRFADGVGVLLEDPDRILVEMGPGNTLVTLSQRHPAKGPGHSMLSSIRHPKSKESDDLAFLLTSLAQVWATGVSIDWRSFVGH